MSLNNVAVQAAVHQHRTLDVDAISRFQQAKIGAIERFFHCRYRVGVAIKAHNRKANAVVSDALVDLKFVGKRAFQRKVDVFFIFPDGYKCSHFFYNTTKHEVVSCFLFMKKKKGVAR